MIATPKGPFWIWTDIDGEGEKWRLAHVTGSGSGAEIHYPMDDFRDYWYPDEVEPWEIVEIVQPHPPKP